MSAKKQRIDQLLVERGLAPSRARAQALIMAGNVVANEKRVDKAGQQLPIDVDIRVKGQDHPWVSRGGLKLQHGLDHFNWRLDGQIVLDVGASTGGFTDVALHYGAEKVHAVDVGHGQLAWKLRQDPRVEVLEKQNARYLTHDLIPDPIDMVVCDASFISLKTVLPAALELLRDGGRLIALIKPQFEVGKENVGKGGVVRDPALHEAVCEDIQNWLESHGHWHIFGVTTSPIKGPEGNVEFLIAAEKRLS